MPVRYGGYESSARTMVDVAAELGRSDGSAPWTPSVHWITTWLACLFPDQLQDEVLDRIKMIKRQMYGRANSDLSP